MATQVDPNVIISSVTLVVAFLALWFSSLRGPAIDFLKVTTPTYQKLADHPTFVPDALYMVGLELLLANNGSRGGLVSSVRIETHPSSWLLPHFVRLNYSAAPIQIAPGESELMPVTASIKLNSWKWFPTKLDPSLGFLAAVQTELNRNKDAFGKFASDIASGKQLGTMDLYVTLTRKVFRTRLHEQKVATIAIPALSASDQDVLTWVANTWFERSPNESELVSEALRQLAVLMGNIQQPTNQEQYKQVGFPVPTAEEWYYDDPSNPSFSNIRRALISWDSDFDRALKRYINQAKIFNVEVIRNRNRSTTDDPANVAFATLTLETLRVVQATLKEILSLQLRIRTSL